MRAFFIFAIIVIMAGCSDLLGNLPGDLFNPGGDTGDTTPPPAVEGDLTTETAGALSFDLIMVSAGTYDMTPDNQFVTSNATLSSSFWMMKTEITYELWSEVFSWATSDRDADNLRDADGGPLYAFANAGTEGDDGDSSSGEPVTHVSWRDAIVWCNALSEMTGCTPVYYTDAGFALPLRIAAKSSSIDTNPGSCDTPYVDWAADGFRLPTEVEWDVAARGGTMAVDGGSFATEYSGSDTIGDVAWYELNTDHTQPASGKAANELGIFDMSGNVNEWCFDWPSSAYPSTETDPTGDAAGSSRAFRGGGWNGADWTIPVDFRTAISPWIKSWSIGFRALKIEQ